MEALIASAKILGLPDIDLDYASDFLANNEYGVCCQTIMTQLYENDVEIDSNIYILISKIAKELCLPLSNYLFMEDLISEETEVSKRAKLMLLENL
nr:MafI family immunity protein [uncultured Pedobacter sp.]